MSHKITVTATVNADLKKTWDFYNQPEHITHWNFADPFGSCPAATNDIREGGKFNARMEAKDGSMGFDFGGVYDAVRNNEYIEYTIGDGRKVKISFTAGGNKTKVSESFEAEDTNPNEMQQGGWQAILDSFKKYTEAN